MVPDKIVLVDEQDNEIGTGKKLEVHRKGLLHRAFSIFIFDWKTKKMLLQQRAYGKYHSGGLWSNACCSHPRKGESMEESLQKRLKDELGYEASFHIAKEKRTEGLSLPKDDEIYEIGSFKYYTEFNGLSEHEIDHVFLYIPDHGHFDGLKPNKAEVNAVKWLSIEEINGLLTKKSELFTAWFIPAYKMVCSSLSINQ